MPKNKKKIGDMKLSVMGHVIVGVLIAVAIHLVAFALAGYDGLPYWSAQVFLVTQSINFVMALAASLWVCMSFSLDPEEWPQYHYTNVAALLGVTLICAIAAMFYFAPRFLLDPVTHNQKKDSYMPPKVPPKPDHIVYMVDRTDGTATAAGPEQIAALEQIGFRQVSKAYYDEACQRQQKLDAASAYLESLPDRDLSDSPPFFDYFKD